MLSVAGFPVRQAAKSHISEVYVHSVGFFFNKTPIALQAEVQEERTSQPSPTPAVPDAGSVLSSHRDPYNQSPCKKASK